MGTLYVVATPIGNIGDISYRAVKTLFEVDVIACEDTRRAGLLLQKLDSMYHTSIYDTAKEKKYPRLISYYEQNELQRIPEIISILQAGQNVALVSDAGTPAISDPGFKLIRECAGQKIRIESLPGASSVLTALTISGLPTDKFTFVGYPPKKPGHRRTFYESIKNSLEALKTTVIIFESPHKILKTLGEIQEIFGEIDIVLCRELTKVHEEVRREKISATLSHFQKATPKGEIVVLFN